MTEKKSEELFFETVEESKYQVSSTSNEKNLVGEHFTLLIILLIACNLLSFFEVNLRESPENFIQTVKDLNSIINNLEMSYKFASTLLSQGNDLLFTMIPILAIGEFINFVLSIMYSLPKHIKNTFLLDMKTQEEIKLTIVMSVGCLFTFYGYYFEFTDHYRTPNAVFDYGDLLIFSVPVITTIIYFLRIRQKTNLSEIPELTNL